jgi:hypothetical protein
VAQQLYILAIISYSTAVNFIIDLIKQQHLPPLLIRKGFDLWPQEDLCNIWKSTLQLSSPLFYVASPASRDHLVSLVVCPSNEILSIGTSKKIIKDILSNQIFQPNLARMKLLNPFRLWCGLKFRSGIG